MSYQSNSDLIFRRTGFYSNVLYSLQRLITDIKGDLASKSCNDKDENAISEVISYLINAELSISTRYQQVLSERIEDLRSHPMLEDTK